MHLTSWLDCVKTWRTARHNRKSLSEPWTQFFLQKCRNILKSHVASVTINILVRSPLFMLHLLSKCSKLNHLKDNHCWQKAATSWTCSSVLLLVQLGGLMLVRLTRNLTMRYDINQCHRWDSINSLTATIVGPKHLEMQMLFLTATCRFLSVIRVETMPQNFNHCYGGYQKYIYFWRRKSGSAGRNWTARATPGNDRFAIASF